MDDDGRQWGGKAGAAGGGRRRAVGQGVCQIVRGGLRLVVPVVGDGKSDRARMRRVRGPS